METSLILIRCLDLIISFLTFSILFIILKKTPKNNFITTMIIMSMALMLSITLFSGVYIIDSLDHVLYSINFYIYWTAFIIMQVCITILWISIFALIRVNNVVVKKTIDNLVHKLKRV
jgi:hypothetical protein